MQPTSDIADILVDADWTRQHLDDPGVRIVEVDVSGAAYNAGHIPGAILWNTYTDLRHSDYTPITSSEFEEVLERSGIGPDTMVVFYGYAPHLAYWLMKSYGHEKVRLMDWPREQWSTAGNSWSTVVPDVHKTQYSLPACAPGVAFSREEVQSMAGAPGRIILDTRSQAEYDGERFWPSGAAEEAGRAGHIPGAVHIPIELLRSSDGQFRSIDEIRDALKSSGITEQSEVVTYCTVGNRAAQAWFALTYLLGYPKAGVYYGSWAEWGTTKDTAVAV
jgi:thiosulfate/3-mercaptopyruvate sulfurtransferase